MRRGRPEGRHRRCRRTGDIGMKPMCISLYDVKCVRLDGEAARPLGDPIAKWWVEEDLNLRPHAYQACALTT